jgi:signal transduction histidine kinase
MWRGRSHAQNAKQPDSGGVTPARDDEPREMRHFSAVVPSGNGNGHASRRGFLARFETHRVRQAELIASLTDVASAVSSTLSVDDVLVTIVDRAKRVTNTDKAILMLTEDGSDELDLETLVVRGRRDQHVQDWWEDRIMESAPAAFSNGVTMLEDEPAHDAVVVYSPIKIQERPIGLLCAINSRDRRFSHEQLDFLAILSAFAATAIENARLAEETRYVLLASERDRIAREIHDGISQSLFSISLGLELAKKQAKKDPGKALERLGDLQEHLNEAMTELRRVVYDLRPMKLQELGLSGAIDFWIKDITIGRPVRGDLEVVGAEYHLGPAREQCLYRVAKEAVSNIVRHSGAKQFTVRVEYRTDGVRLAIRDDGDGFPIDAALEARVEGSGMGLRSIQERVKREHGTFEIDSVQGEGTRIEVRLPVGEAS